MSRYTGAIRPTKELFNLLYTIYRYQYIRSSFLYELVPSTLRATRKQITNRKAQGFITTPVQQYRNYLSHCDFAIYQNTDKGDQLLFNMAARDNQRLDTATKVPLLEMDRESREFPHTMMVSDAIASIEIGINQLEGYEFINWCQIVDRATEENPLKLPYSVSHNGQSRSGTITGDGLFGFRRPNGKASFFILEAERQSPKEPTSLARSSTLLKVLAYNDIIKKQAYTKCGANNMRVLFVFPTEARAREACKMAERVVGSTNRFLFTSIPTQFQLLKSPLPFPEIVTKPLMRPGGEQVSLTE